MGAARANNPVRRFMVPATGISRALSCYDSSEVSTQPMGKRMSTITSDSRAVPAGEPKPIIPPLASFYSHARDLSWLVVRLTAGGKVLAPRVLKSTPQGGKHIFPTPPTPSPPRH